MANEYSGVIELLQNESEIADILEEFKLCLPSLQKGQVNIKEHAHKFALYACVIKLVIQEDVAAFAAFYCNNISTQVAFLSMIAVKPEFKRRGYGSEILKAAESMSVKVNMKSMQLQVARTNASAQAFYKKLGYCSIKEDETSVFMSKKLL